MGKLSYNLYNDKKLRMNIRSLSFKYKIRKNVITYLTSFVAMDMRLLVMEC